MKWGAYFQEDGFLRHTIIETPLKHRAEFEAEKFVRKITHPEIGEWFIFVEEIKDDVQS